MDDPCGVSIPFSRSLRQGSSSRSAGASQIISTSTVSGLRLQLNDKGEALLTYTSAGKRVHVLVWGAVNAAATKPGARQVSFQLDYSGGYQKYFLHNPEAQALAREYKKIRGTPGYLTSPVVKKLQALQQEADNYWQTAFHGGCGHYNGPALAWKVVACKAPDGSYWAVQSWQRKLPNYGLPSGPSNNAWEVHLSHWTGPLPVLTVNTDWSWHQWNHLYGTFTYDGVPVFGLHSTSTGQPLDTFGRNLYLDTLDSAYGTGLEAREQLPHAQGRRRVLLQREPAPGPPGGHRHRVPGDDHGPGRHPRRRVGRPRARPVRQGDRRAAEPRDLGPPRLALPPELISGRSRRPRSSRRRIAQPHSLARPRGYGSARGGGRGGSAVALSAVAGRGVGRRRGDGRAGRRG